MNRVGAFLIHLGISLVIFGVLAAVIVYVWYPDFFFTADGGWQGIRIVALVDLVLGPLLTLIVFDIRKPRSELRRDLSLIGIVQATCLLAGTYVVYSERPLALVYVDGQFYSVSADDYAEAHVETAELEAIPGPYPKRVAVDIPDDPWLQSDLRREAFQQRRPLRVLASRYVPLRLEHMDPDADALSGEWLTAREEKTGDVSEWLARHGGAVDDYAFFRFGARYGYLVLGVSRVDGRVAGLLKTPLDPVERAPASELAETSS
jgi:hypothetical protein